MLAEKASCHHKDVQLPELMQGHASPDTSHAQHGRHDANQLQPSAAPSHIHADAKQQHTACATQNQVVQGICSDQEVLQSELTFRHSQAPVPAAVYCLRCGVKSGREGHDCRFHPALLQDPGPFLYSPEWHACRAAKHGAASPGCFVRQGHYFPGHAVQATGLAKAHAAGCRSNSRMHTRPEHPLPRTHLPFPAQRK